MGGRSLQYVMLSPPSTRTDGVARLELYGDARVTGGVLRLTDLLPGFSVDDVIIDGSRDEDAVWSDGQADLGLDSMHTTSLGTAILTLRRPYNALFWWEVRFDINVGSNSQVGSEGFSVCVGELPDAGFGESGGGTGLRVNFKTAYNGLYEMLELWYAEVMLHQVWTPAWLGLGSGLGLG